MQISGLHTTYYILHTEKYWHSIYFETLETSAHFALVHQANITPLVQYTHEGKQTCKSMVFATMKT